MVVEARLEEFPNGILCDGDLMAGCQETGGVQENDEEEEEVEDDLTNEGDDGGMCARTWQNWEERSWEQRYHEWIRVKDGKGRENNVSTKAAAISQRREAHASLQVVIAL